MSAKTVRAGKAEVELGVKDRMQKGLDAAAKRLRSFGMGAAKIGGAITAAGMAVLAPFGASIKAASDLEETMNKFNVVFGDQAKSMKEWGDTFAGEVGRSKQQVADFLASNQDLLVPIGLDPAAAQQMSKDLLGLTYDLASFNNLQDADVARDLQAALTGSGEVMKKYGVIVSQATVNQALLNKGLDPKHATEAQKAQARFDVILAGTTAAQGDAIRSGGSWANQLKALRARIADTAAAIGTAILPQITRWLTIGVKIVSSIQQWIEENQSLITIVAYVGAALVATGAVISAIAGTALAASFAMLGLKLAIGAIAAVFAALTSPVGLVIGLIAAATWAFLRFTDAGQQLWTRIKDTLGKAWAWVKQVFEGIYKAVGAGDLELAAQIAWTAVLAVIANAVDWIIGAMDGLRGMFGETFGAMLDLIRSGDWQGAAELAMAALGAAWATGIANLMANWGSYIRAIVETFAGAMAQVAKLWVSTQGGISKGILALAQQEGVVGDMMAKILGVDVRAEDKRRQQLAADLDPVRRRNLEGAIGITENRLAEATDPQEIEQLNQALAHFRRELGQPATSESVNDQLMGSIDAQTQASRDAIDAYVGDSLSQFTQWQDTAQDRADDANQDLANKITAANDQAETQPSWADQQNEELRQLLERADVAAVAAEKPDPPDLDLDDGLGRAAALPALATASSWAVQAIAATGSAGRSPEEQIVENTRETNRQLREMNDRDKLRKRVAFK